VSGQEDPGIEIKPAILDLNGLPGEKIKFSVKLTNTYDNALGVRVSSRLLAPEDELINSAEAYRYDASQWLNVSKEFIIIEGNESIDVPLEIIIPDNAVPGGHYSLITFKIEAISQFDASGITIKSEVGAVTLITVPGDTVENAYIVDDSSSLVSFGGVFKFSQTIFNDGNIHLLPTIETNIINSKGEIVDKIVQPYKLLLPNTKRTLITEWDSKKYFGKYTAQTTVSFGTPTQNINSDVLSIFILPSITTLIFWTVTIYIVIRLIHRYYYKKSSVYRDSFDVSRQKSGAVRIKLIVKVRHKIKNSILWLLNKLKQYKV
jgi:hypothetical protein